MPKLIQEMPPKNLAVAPSAVVALACALEARNAIYTVSALIYDVEFGIGGWLTPKKMNQVVRKWLLVQKFVYYKRDERPKLKNLELDEGSDAIVYVSDHYLYMHGNTYKSFEDNAEDEIIAVWHLKP